MRLLGTRDDAGRTVAPLQGRSPLLRVYVSVLAGWTMASTLVHLITRVSDTAQRPTWLLAVDFAVAVALCAAVLWSRRTR